MNTASDALRSDHRRIEAHLDTLLALLLPLDAGKVSGVRQEFTAIRALAAPHFEKEEKVVYPRLRGVFPELLSRMDEQHEHTREVGQFLQELLSSISEPPTPRELTELRRFGIEFHDAIQHHIVEEENDLLRIADAELSADEQAKLFERMQALA